MHVDSFSYDHRAGWSVSQFPPGDSESTLVIVFGAPRFLEDGGPIDELVKAYPRAVVTGCSSVTAGLLARLENFGPDLATKTVRVDAPRPAGPRLGRASSGVT